MTIEKKSLISTLKTTKKANAVKEDVSGGASVSTGQKMPVQVKLASKGVKLGSKGVKLGTKGVKLGTKGVKLASKGVKLAVKV
ncbi:MAG TPA: hypothetical protein VMB02_01585 [Candidatus Aquilonibacter sp.]|nr:hypothetical protein [Candidatus Aquilonibacter sp.]